jgi:hypothetical protein
MEKHQTNLLLLAFFLHIKSICLWELTTFIPHVKKGTPFNVFIQQHKQSKNIKIKTKNNTGESVKEREIRERERERERYPRGKNNKFCFVAKVCSLQNFLFQSLVSHYTDSLKVVSFGTILGLLGGYFEKRFKKKKKKKRKRELKLGACVWSSTVVVVVVKRKFLTVSSGLDCIRRF